MEHQSDEEIKRKIIEKTDKLAQLLSVSPLNVNYEYIFDIVLSTNNYERQIISYQYKLKYGKTIQDAIEAVLVPNVKEIIKYMFYNPYELDARFLNRAIKAKKDEKVVVEIFASRPHWFLQVVNNEYKRLFGVYLKEEIEKEKGEFYKFILAIYENPRSTEKAIKKEDDAKREVEKILKNGVKKYGNDIDLFKELFVLKSREDLILICREFALLDKKKRNLYDVVDDVCSSKTKEILKALIYAVTIPSHYFAHLIKKSIVGLGTDDETLIRVLVTRAEVDMEFIRTYYKLETKRELRQDIKGDTSGPYQSIALKLSEK